MTSATAILPLRRAVIMAAIVAVTHSCATAEPLSDRTDEVEAVVLLHGLARGSGSMRKIERDLASKGYFVCNVSYPSRKEAPGALLATIETRIDECLGDAPHSRKHFVTHSLGGIMTRALIDEDRPAKLGRVVMLAPPNHGSELVDVYANAGWFRWAMGPTAVELGTDAASLPNRLGPADYELGIIAGSKPVHPLGVWILDEPSDGTVTIESARLDGMRDLVVVPRSHSFIMGAPEVAHQVSSFLAHGCFDRAADRSTFPDDDLPCSTVTADLEAEE